MPFHFRIYLGPAPGVGKTYAMLAEGHRRRSRGTDVVIGFVEGHQRSSTEELVEGLEVVPPTRVEYRGTTFSEMDLDAVLRRRPQLALVDELAHTNAPGSGRHEKRWQDVEELLDAGIDVVSTVNIQHLESIADAVERITGTPVGERVPDWVLREADQIELVDSSPELLHRRMERGEIYPSDMVPQALDQYFRRENLIALRELALRFLADETEEELLGYLRRHQSEVQWETSERILVGVASDADDEALIRRASRIGARLKASIHVLHAVGGDGRAPADDRRMEQLRRVASDVGADWEEIQADDPAVAIVEFARSRQVTWIMVGSSRKSRWRVLRAGSHFDRIAHLAGEAGIDVHMIARGRSGPEGP